MFKINQYDSKLKLNGSLDSNYGHKTFLNLKLYFCFQCWFFFFVCLNILSFLYMDDASLRVTVNYKDLTGWLNLHGLFLTVINRGYRKKTIKTQI